jgi:hypothetical protein
MKRTILWFSFMGCLVIWSAAAFGQATGQPAVPPAAPPAAGPTVVPPPAEQPPAVQPAIQTTPLPSPPPRSSKGAGHHRFFDPNTVETLTGEVVSVQRGPVRQGGKGNLVRFTLKTDKGPVQVFLGPAKYVDAQTVKLTQKDQVEVKASRITGPQGKTTFTAAEVTKGGQVMKLRDDQGTPLWPKGQGRKRHRAVAPRAVAPQ